jgi:hypothetical protein
MRVIYESKYEGVFDGENFKIIISKDVFSEDNEERNHEHVITVNEVSKTIKIMVEGIEKDEFYLMGTIGLIEIIRDKKASE